MKSTTLLQYLFAISIASLIVFLFFNSRFDNDLHQRTIVDILTFLEYDSRIRLQVIELQQGHRKNYGGLVAAMEQQKRIIDSIQQRNQLKQSNQITSLSDLLIDLRQERELRDEDIEFFKRENAVLRNTLHYLPKFIDTLSGKIVLNSGLDAESIDQALLVLKTISSDIFIFQSQTLNASYEIRKRLNEMETTLLALLPDSLHDDISKTFAHTSIIVKLHSSTRRSIENIQASRTGELARRINEQVRQHFAIEQKHANIYRYWLFATSLLLLLYLAITFFKLQNTTSKLRDSLDDLEFHKAAIDEHCIVSITDTKGTLLYANERFCKISKYSKEELIGKNHRIIKSDVHDKAFFRSMWRVISNGGKWHGIFANRARDGSIYWVDSTILPRMNAQGKPYQYIGIRTDITAQKEAEQEAVLQARFPAENPEPVMRIDHLGHLLYANRASAPILNHWKLRLGSQVPEEWLAICSRALSNDQREDHELKVGKIHYSILFTPIKAEHYTNLYARDITQIKHAEKTLNYQATHDPLTALYNRYAFENKLEETLTLAQENGGTSILLYIDLDQFKIVNDTCGHVAGDELLRQISSAFVNSMRESDFLARLGGDEFGVILHNCDIDHGEQIAGKILETINNFRFLWEDKSFEIGASIGLVEIDQQSDSVVSLLGEADIACYAAKDSGRNRLQIFRDDQAVSQRKDDMHWAVRIPKALAEDRFLIYGQLIKPLQETTGETIHYELLLRLQDEDSHIIPPGAFIPAAERYGLMHSIDMHVIAKAFEQLQAFHKHNRNQTFKLSINLSGHSLGNKHILDYIPQMFERFNIEPRHITFEITETSAISNLTAAIKFITTLKILGCEFALDDFGSGLSSFAYLKNLPVDYLKIDGAFVKDILHDPIDAAMVQSINQIGHVMNIKTIAEFVENEEIEKRLRMISVDYAQGYGIEKPRPLQDILQQHSQDESLRQNIGTGV